MSTPVGPFHNVSLAGYSAQKIQNLQAFDKQRHSLPRAWDSYSVEFVQQLATKEIELDLESKFQNLRSEFQLKRKEITAVQSELGCASVVTPEFEYCIQVEVDETTFDSIVWKRQVHNIKSSEVVLCQSFSAVFDLEFDRVESCFDAPIDLEAWIDHIEDLDNAAMKLDYNAQLTRCQLRFQPVSALIELTAEKLVIQHPNKDRASRIFKSYLEIQKSILAGMANS
ncbi:MAG: hypothetical protein AAGA30_07630 [Planctomycetota bacterium]